MKKNILATCFFILTVSFASTAQDAKAILQKSYAKCQSVKNGYYEMTRYFLAMTQKDTSVTSFNCFFKKIPDDTIYNSAFHYKRFDKTGYISEAMYTGNDFVWAYAKDSSAEIMSKSKWAKEIKEYKHNYTFYSPLTSKGSDPLPDDSDFIKNKLTFKFVGEENVNNALCYHIQANHLPENDSSEPMKVLKIEYHFWIKKEDMVPVQYSTAFDVAMNHDTMHQYEKLVLNKYELNNLKDEAMLALTSIPSFYKLKEYTPYKAPDLLPKDTIAPDWSLFSLKNEKVSLKDQSGKLVMIDFFYKGCFPCMQALPALQALHEKYKGKGLAVIGIDPYDKPEDNMGAFLAKWGVSYTILLGGKDVSKDYHVSGYPTIYIIAKNGKVIATQVGFGQGMEDGLEDIIKKNL